MTTLNINKPFNIHRSKHKYPQNDQEWGYYLAGLIDADGSFTDVSKHKPNLTICFHIKDISLAYKIKKFIKYGTISKIKNKNACKYVLTHKQGLQRLLLLLQDKIKHVEKYRRYLLLCQYYQIKGQDIFFDSGMTEKFNQDNQDNLKTSKKNCEILQFDAPEGASNVSFQKQFNLLNNYWLAGFIDGDGSLQIKIIKRKKKPEIRLQLQIDLNENFKYLLDNIRLHFGGYIGYRKNLKAYCYNSTSFQVFGRLINYLDYYSLCSNKYKEYVLWRRAYFIRKDVNKINNLKKTLSCLKK